MLLLGAQRAVNHDSLRGDPQASAAKLCDQLVVYVCDRFLHGNSLSGSSITV
jgi:hypothetical protein